MLLGDLTPFWKIDTLWQFRRCALSTNVDDDARRRQPLPSYVLGLTLRSHVQWFNTNA